MREPRPPSSTHERPGGGEEYEKMYEDYVDKLKKRADKKKEEEAAAARRPRAAAAQGR